MDKAVDADVLRFAVVVDVLKQRIEFVDRIDAVGLTAGLGTAGFSCGRQERIVRIDVFRGEEEFEFRGYYRPPVALLIETHYAP